MFAKIQETVKSEAFRSLAAEVVNNIVTAIVVTAVFNAAKAGVEMITEKIAEQNNIVSE